MSTRVIVKNDNENYKGFKCTWHAVGLVEDSSNFEADRQDAEELIERFPDFYIDGEKEEEKKPEEVIAPKSEVNGLTTGPENELTGTTELSEAIKADTGPEGTNGSAEEGSPLVSEDGRTPNADDKEAMIAALQDKKRAELEDLCKSFPGNEWRGKNKEALIEYLTGKINEA